MVAHPRSFLRSGLFFSGNYFQVRALSRLQQKNRVPYSDEPKTDSNSNMMKEPKDIAETG